MLCRKRSDYLLKAIQAYTFNKQNNIAAGLKSALYYLLKKIRNHCEILSFAVWQSSSFSTTSLKTFNYLQLCSRSKQHICKGTTIIHKFCSPFPNVIIKYFTQIFHPNIWVDGGGGHCLVRMEWRPARWAVCLPLLIFPCTMKNRGSLLASAHPGGPGKRAVKWLWLWGCGCGGIWAAAVHLPSLS